MTCLLRMLARCSMHHDWQQQGAQEKRREENDRLSAAGQALVIRQHVAATPAADQHWICATNYELHTARGAAAQRVAAECMCTFVPYVPYAPAVPARCAADALLASTCGHCCRPYTTGPIVKLQHG
jgi:hypothetical protein